MTSQQAQLNVILLIGDVNLNKRREALSRKGFAQAAVYRSKVLPESNRSIEAVRSSIIL